MIAVSLEDLKKIAESNDAIDNRLESLSKKAREICQHPSGRTMRELAIEIEQLRTLVERERTRFRKLMQAASE